MRRRSVAASLSVLAAWVAGIRAARGAGEVDGRARRAPICFGGVPETAVSGATGASDLSIADGHLYWSNAGRRGFSRGEPGTSGYTVPDGRFGDDLQVCAVDGHEIFAVGDDDEIVAFDQRDGAFRVLQAAASPANGSMLRLLDCRVKVDERYLYFSRNRTFPEAGRENGFFRLRRDGTSQAERLGPPIPGDSPVALGGGHVYFHARLPSGRLALVRRALTPDAPQETVTALPAPDPQPRFPQPGLLRVLDGVVYYSDQASGGSIWSVPANGRGKPERRAALGEIGAVDMLVEGGCLYWANGTQIWRQALAGPGGVRPELVADRRTYHDDLRGSGARLASDGHYLYWTDTGGNRLWRAARTRRSLPLRVVNSPGGGSPANVSAGYVTVGDGWGCLGSGAPSQCWSAGAVGSTPERIDAHRVLWLDGLKLEAGPDRLCAVTSDRNPPCWRWPDIGRHQPRAVPDARSNQDAQGLHVGGTFTCSTSSNIWTCAGDDRFGQLAATGTLIQRVSASGGLGRWHGCMRIGDDVSCWGRADGGQLGFEAADSCRDGSETVACSRSPRAVQFTLPSQAQLLAGDMFTCTLADTPDPATSRSVSHLQCWGASRDGLFGSVSACPAGLKTRWPTLSGPVPAPGLTCSPIPVEVPGLPASSNQFSVGPRGVCATRVGRRHSETRCAGAIATPSLEVRNIAAEPGDRASACGIAGRDVVCWGDGYSPPDNPGLPIRITFDQSPLPHTSALDAAPPGDSPWPAACGIHYACEQAARPLAACAPGVAAQPWTDLQPKAATLVGKKVGVRSPLALSAVDPHVAFRSAQNCGDNVCCSTEDLPVIIGGAYQDISLDGFQCSGDESRHCCNVPALGQTVVAQGILANGARTRWSLAHATLCAAASRP